VIHLAIISRNKRNKRNDNKSSAVAEMGDRLATIDMGRKVGGGCCGPFLEERGSWVPI